MTRRHALLAVAAGSLAAACGSATPTATTSAPASPVAAALNDALREEERALAAYDALSIAVGPSAKALLSRLRDHHVDRRDQLIQAVAAAGASPATKLPQSSPTPALSPGPGPALGALARMERDLVAADLRLAGTLTDPRQLQLAASLAAGAAQAAVALAVAAGADLGTVSTGG